MKKSISTKRVLENLLAAYNDNSIAVGYSSATEDHETANECRISEHVICNLLRDFGFREGAEYKTVKEEKTIGGVTFSWYRKVVKA